jgi:hypothetical protein
MRILAKGTLIAATAACLALGTGTSYGGMVGNPHSGTENHARKAPMADLEPNHYVLNGNGLHVTYDSTGLVGKPQLTYQDRRQTLHFAGPDIRQVASDAGTLVSVTTVMTIDTGSTTFSLLIPRVAVRNGQPAQIHSLGITTVHRLTIDTPARGQLDTYQFRYLAGTASVVEFYRRRPA